MCLFGFGLNVFCSVPGCACGRSGFSENILKVARICTGSSVLKAGGFLNLLPWQVELATACLSKSMRKFAGPTRCRS